MVRQSNSKQVNYTRAVSLVLLALPAFGAGGVNATWGSTATHPETTYWPAASPAVERQQGFSRRSHPSTPLSAAIPDASSLSFLVQEPLIRPEPDLREATREKWAISKISDTAWLLKLRGTSLTVTVRFFPSFDIHYREFIRVRRSEIEESKAKIIRFDQEHVDGLYSAQFTYTRTESSAQRWYFQEYRYERNGPFWYLDILVRGDVKDMEKWRGELGHFPHRFQFNRDQAGPERIEVSYYFRDKPQDPLFYVELLR
jgi:hypothetical protein